jgi:16S rRNA (cytosine967-C5)-methyltransferase
VPLSPARRRTFEILLRVERDQAWASELLNAPAMDKLSREDRALCHALVMTTLRWQSALDARLAPCSSQPLSRLDAEVRVALRLAACQLFRLDRIPAHAAVHESVELVKRSGKRSAAPFANAVLRKLSSAGKASEKPAEARSEATSTGDDAAHLAAEFAHPQWLVERWISMYGLDDARTICEADQIPPQAALRLTAPDVEPELRAEGVTVAPGALLSGARRLISGELAQSRAFLEGRVAVQDEASQLVAALVGGGTRILDCCAAPGGKTAAMAARNPESEIVAVELHEHRARALEERLRALPTRRHPVQVLAGNIAGMRLPGKFDRVLADVPCSGTGTLAANPEIKWRLRADEFAPLQQLQLAILQAAAAALAPGGRLVYSTCSLEAEEGEAVVERFLRDSPGHALLDCTRLLEELRRGGELAWPEPDTLTRGPFLRTLPGRHPCDGFFAAVLQSAAE